jgi:DNA gyrase subunit A
VTRRTVFELGKARERAHILEGLAVALSNVDEIIALIKSSANRQIAKDALMAKSWPSQLVKEMIERAPENASRPLGISVNVGLFDDGYRLSDTQAVAILEMQLQRLTGLEQEKIIDEYKEVMDKIIDLLDILANSHRITKIISDELLKIKESFGDQRRSEIVINTEDIDMEDLITPEEMVVTLSHDGYIKAQSINDYKAQKRGGRGKQATATKEDDFIDRLFVANTHDHVLCFTSLGRVHWLRVFNVPVGSRTSRGKPVNNLLQIEAGEKINALLPVKEFDDKHFVFMATAFGTVKKTPLTDFSRPRSAGIIAVDLDDNDYLVGASITNGTHDVMLFSDDGKAIRFDENDVRPMGRTARGVRGMRLANGQKVISMLVADNEEQTVLTATQNGFGKRTRISEFTRHGRGGQGVIAIQTSQRNGPVVSAALVNSNDELMLITSGGVLIRTRVQEIREMSRATQGVTLISLDDGETLVSLSRIDESADDTEINDQPVDSDVENLADKEDSLGTQE